MFNVLIAFDETAWETDQLMRMDVSRFHDGYSGVEAESILPTKPQSLKALESIPTLLMYESGTKGSNSDIVRYGYLRNIRVAGKELIFQFEEEGRFTRAIIQEFANLLGIDRWEQTRTHWAVKDAGIPKAMLGKLQRSYDVVFSFAGEDRKYIESVANYLRARDVKIFYDEYEEANLWGKDLAEHLDSIYRHNGQYCVMFISKHYAQKMWTRHERRSALARALKERDEYILPARFDDTDIPGISPTVAHISLSNKSPMELGEIILKKLNKK